MLIGAVSLVGLFTSIVLKTAIEFTVQVTEMSLRCSQGIRISTNLRKTKQDELEFQSYAPLRMEASLHLDA